MRQIRLIDKLKKQREEELEAAYAAASKDKEREAEAKEWSSIGNNKIEGWDWEHQENP